MSAGPHIFTVDVEEYFHVSAFEPHIPRERWPTLESRLEISLSRLLDRLAHHDTLGTFFVLGSLVDAHASLIRRIADAGHEVASHGWSHTRLTRLDPESLRMELRRSREALEDLVQRPVRGFRAPSFSIVPGGEWAFDILLEEGYTYDSSLFPIRRRGYGYPSAPRVPHVISRPGGQLLELPLTTTRVGPVRLPASGGAYFRHLPYGLTRRAFREYASSGVPGMFYIHPWELDPEQPRVSCPPLTRLRHYGGIPKTEARLERLLSEFAFTSVDRIFDVHGGGSATRPASASEAGTKV